MAQFVVAAPEPGTSFAWLHSPASSLVGHTAAMHLHWRFGTADGLAIRAWMPKGYLRFGDNY